MIIAYFTMTVGKGTRQEFLDEMRASGAFDKARAEAGNISYDYYLSADDATVVVGIERWERLEHFQAHLGQDYVQALGKLQENYGVVMDPYLYEASLVEE